MSGSQIRVMKFGGSSLAGPREFVQSLSIIKEDLAKRKDSRLIVVCSASGDTTDHLMKVANLAKRSTTNFEEARSVIEGIRDAHSRIILEAIPDPQMAREATEYVEAKLSELDKLLYGVSLVKDCSPRSLDLILSFGERLSSFIMKSLLVSSGINSVYLTGGEAGIVTDETFGSAQPIFPSTEDNLVAKLVPLLNKGTVPVVTGFLAETLRGHEIITLGRGGSDYTASLIASALDAEEVTLWTDVDGIMTADPELVGDTRIVEQITYQEAMEMSAFGAKSMQPRALEPVANKAIPVRIRNTFNPSSRGTLIVSPAEIRNGFHSGIKCVGSLSDVAIVSITGPKIVGLPGTALAIFEILKELGVSLLMISQSVSESNVSFVIRRGGLEEVILTLRERLLPQHGGIAKDGERYPERWRKKDSAFANVEFEDDVAVIGVLGRGMIGMPGIAGRVFSTVAKEGINIRMIAQGSSEMNISFVVKGTDRKRAVAAIHEGFGLGTPRNTREEEVEGLLKNYS